jgi:hypothetical protein
MTRERSVIEQDRPPNAPLLVALAVAVAAGALVLMDARAPVRAPGSAEEDAEAPNERDEPMAHEGAGMHEHAPMHGGRACGDPAAPLLIFGDLDADGTVDADDVAMIRRQLAKSSEYRALYDRNADHVVDERDVAIVEAERGFASTPYDREIAAMYHRFEHFQAVEDAEQLRPELRPLTAAIAGHGEHWATNAGLRAAQGEERSSFQRVEGLNVPDDGSGVWAMFWVEAATPVFEGGATDWPTRGGKWQSQRVIAFADQPPKHTSDPRERWHAHVGLCLFENAQGELETQGPTTYDECQAYPTANPAETRWLNIWMLHMWLFELNPSGIWGNLHPCLDPSAPTEEEIVGEREVPRFFTELH